MHSSKDKTRLERVRVWDPTIRIVHWAIVVLVLVSWWSGENDWHEIHLVSGYLILALVLTRIYWGLFGSTTARFSNFVRGPGAILTYARQLFRRPGHIAGGHNPIGAISVVILLGLLAVQPILGLFARDINGRNSGPLSHHVGYSTGRSIADLHNIVFELLVIFVALHVLAVLFYVFFKRDNILWAMISGLKNIPQNHVVQWTFVSTRHAAIVFTIIGGGLCALHFLGSGVWG